VLTRLGIATGLVAAAVAQATPAHADEASYLKSLQNRGVDQYLSTAEALSSGQWMCAELRQGRSVNGVYSDLLDRLYMAGKLPSGATGQLMGAAWNNLCPDQGERVRNTKLSYISDAGSR